MKKIKIISILLSLALIISALAGCSAGIETKTLTKAERNKYRGEQIFNSAMDKYFDSENLLTQQYYSFEEEDAQDTIADIWHYSSLQEAALYYLQAFPTSVKAKTAVDNIYKGLAYYQEKRDDDYTVYSLYRATEPIGNVQGFNLYDDNSCIVRNLVHQAALTGDKKVLDHAKNTMSYITDNGWDKSINEATGEEWGGNDQGPASANYYKPICANEYTTMDLLMLAELSADATEKANYLALGKKYYDWIIKTFRLENNMFGDYIGVERKEGKTVGHGVVALDMYTYHQGSMIEDGVRLYNLTKEEKYLTQAKETAIASNKFFGRRDIIEGMYQLPYNIYHWFNVALLRSYIMLAEIDSSFTPFVDEIQASLDYAYDNFYRDGMLPCNFLQGWIVDFPFDEKINIMDPTAYAQYYFMLADFYA